MKRINTRIKNKRSCAPKEVYQYTLDKIFIKKYKSPKDASIETGIDKGTIIAACNRKSAGIDFIWSYTSDVSCVKINKVHKKKRVIQMDEDYNFIKEWDCLMMAEKFYKTKNISRACVMSYMCAGYRWKFA